MPWVEVAITSKIKQFLLSLLAIACEIHLFLFTPLAPASRFSSWFSFYCQQVFDKTEARLLVIYRSGFIFDSDKDFFQKVRLFKILHFLRVIGFNLNSSVCSLYLMFKKMVLKSFWAQKKKAQNPLGTMFLILDCQFPFSTKNSIENPKRCLHIY